MRRKKSIGLVLSAAMVMMSCALAGARLDANTVSKEANATIDGTGFERYIGYGYNPAKGVPLVDTTNALHFSSPILDVNNPALWQNVEIKADITTSSSDTRSFTSSSATAMASSIGTSMAGGITGKVKMVSVDLNTKFEIQRDTATTSQELFSYYSMIVPRRAVALQSNEIRLRNYLHPNFLADAKLVNSPLAAENFLNKYGSHLLSGYRLGGLLETTFYLAAKSDSEIVAQNFELKSQIEAAMGVVKAGASVDFSSQHSHEYNEETTTTHYHFTAYGGDAFPSLTINDLFAYKGGELSEDKNLNYSIWTQSLNEDKSLAIVDIPKNSPLIGVWELLPSTSEYINAKPYLMEAYITQCANAVQDHSYSDLVQRISLPKAEEPAVALSGYELHHPIKADDYSRVLSSYVSLNNNTTATISVRPGDILAFDYNSAEFDGFDISWSVTGSGASNVEILSARDGVFKIKSTSSKVAFKVVATFGDKVVEKNCEIDPALDFTGGKGTEEDPYLIATADELVKFLKNENVTYNSNHFRLIEDIDLSGKTTGLKPMGTNGGEFTGTFDGDGHKISNFALGLENIVNNGDSYGGLFGATSGATISNLTLENPSLVVDLSDAKYKNDDNTAANKLVAAGALVGYAEQGTTITNCKVINPNINIDRGDYFYQKELRYTTSSEFYVGGLVGRNEGSIDHVTVEGGNVHGKLGQNSNRICGVGGLVGINGFKSDTSKAGVISNIEIKNVDIFSRLRDGNKWDDRETMAGGVIGVGLDLDLENINVNYLTSGLIKADSYNGDGYNEEWVYAGGLVGYLYDFNNNKNPITNASIKGRKDFIEVEAYGSNKYKGFVAGGVLNLDSNLECSSVKGDTSTNSYAGVRNSSNPSGYTGASNIAFVSIQPVSGDGAISIDVTNTYREFLTGDQFKTGPITVKVGEKEVKDYWIDYSKFNSNVAGNKEIIVSRGDEKASYTVHISSAPVDHIEVEEKDPTLVRYKDEVLTVEDFKYTVVNVNGTTSVITPTTQNVKITMEPGDGALVKGDNRFTFRITYNGEQFGNGEQKSVQQVIVNAQDRQISSVAWVDEAPSFEAFTTTRISSSNIMRGASFEVNYDHGGKIVYEFVTNNTLRETIYDSNNNTGASVTKDRNDANVEIVIPSISVGNNAAKVCFDDYHTLDFNIVGVEDASDHSTEIVRLQNYINAIDQTETLSARFDAIKIAKNYAESFTWTTDELDLLIDSLNQKVKAYNNEGKTVNEEIADTLGLTLGMNGFVFDKRTASILSIILAVAFAI